ncbi:MAG: biotin/lipoyl-binding protein [Aureliella sp.]
MSKLPGWLVSRRWLFVPPVVVGVAILAFFASRKKELPRKEFQEVATPISVVRVEYQPIQPMAVGYGTTKAARIWTAVSEVAGRIVRTHPKLESGTPVQAGEVLIEIDRTDYEIRVQQRQADYDKAVANANELQAAQQADQTSTSIEQELLEVTQNDLERQLGLRRTNVISETELENAKSNLLRQRASVQRLKNSLSLYPSKIAAAKAAVNLAESRLAEARRDLERTKVVAPFSGTLAGVDLQPNQVVVMNERLFELWDASVVEVEAQFSPSQLAGLLPQGASRYQSNESEMLGLLEAEIVLRSGDFERSFPAKPVRLGEAVDQRTRTLSVVVQLSLNPQEIANTLTANQSLLDRAPLLSGAFSEVILRGPQQATALSVPRTALENGFVYIVDSEDRLRRTKVSIGTTIGDIRIVTDGLVAGALVAIRPPVPAIDGQLVDPHVVGQPMLGEKPDASTSEESSGPTGVAEPPPTNVLRTQAEATL